jgi:transcriptional regulator with XRE-family HTH domain
MEGGATLFKDRLKALREDNDLTQEELAKHLHINRSTLSNYENLGREPNYALLIKIANHFKVSTDYLLGRTDIPTPYPKKLK